ncbi:MAG: MFS transporter [Pseudomonadota bacterium]
MVNDQVVHSDSNLKLCRSLLILALPILIINVEYSGIAVVIPTITISLKMSLAHANWIAMAYLLIFSAFLVTGGKLGDLYTAKRMMAVGLCLFAAGSFISGLAVTSWQMIIGRGLQGLGAAIAFPNIMSVAYNIAPENRKGFVLGLLTGITGLSMAIGPLLGGFLTSYSSWRLFFLINVPISLLTIYAIFYYFPKAKLPHGRKPLDRYGIVLFSIFLISIIYGLNTLKSGIQAIHLLGYSAIVMLVSLGLFIYNECKVSEPLMPWQHIKNTEVLVGCLIRAAINFGFYIVLFSIGLYLHFVMGLSAAVSGFVLFPMSLLMGIMSFLSGKLIDYCGVYVPTITGVLLLVLCYIGFIFLPIQKHLIFIIGLLACYGIGYTFISPGLIKLTLNAVDESTRGFVSGMFYMMSVFGSTVGMAITGIVLSRYQHLSEQQNLIQSFPKLMSICLSVALFALIMLIARCKFSQKVS